MEDARKQDDEQNAKPEDGHRNTNKREHHRHTVNCCVFVHGRKDTKRDAHKRRNGNRDKRQFNGCRETRHEFISYRRMGIV